MGKIWLKTKYDAAMGMEIPHSVNIANAMYGFRELGAEIIRRTLLVEMNDTYALGCYGLPSLFYAKLISARWSQLLNRKDEYHF